MFSMVNCMLLHLQNFWPCEILSVCGSLPKTSNPMMLLREDNLPGCWKTWCDFVKQASKDTTAQIIMSCPKKKCVGIVFKMSLLLFLQYHCLQNGLEFRFLNNFFQLKTQMRMWQVTHTPPSCRNISCAWVLCVDGESRVITLSVWCRKNQVFWKAKSSIYMA